jgi:hypothetical protein
MRRTASEVLRSLEMRVARLEREAVSKKDIIPESSVDFYSQLYGERHEFEGKTWNEVLALRPDLERHVNDSLKTLRLKEKMEGEIKARGWRRNHRGAWERDGVTAMVMENTAKKTLHRLDGLDKARDLVESYVSGDELFSTGRFPAPYPASKAYDSLAFYSRNSVAVMDYFRALLESKGGRMTHKY